MLQNIINEIFVNELEKYKEIASKIILGAYQNRSSSELRELLESMIIDLEKEDTQNGTN